MSSDASQGEGAGTVWGGFQEEETAGGQAARQEDCLEGAGGIGGSPLLTHPKEGVGVGPPSSALVGAVPGCPARPSSHLPVRFLFSDEHAPAGLHSCPSYCGLAAAVPGTVTRFLAGHPFEAWGTGTVLHVSLLTPHLLIWVPTSSWCAVTFVSC